MDTTTIISVKGCIIRTRDCSLIFQSLHISVRWKNYSTKPLLEVGTVKLWGWRWNNGSFTFVSDLIINLTSYTLFSLCIKIRKRGNTLLTSHSIIKRCLPRTWNQIISIFYSGTCLCLYLLFSFVTRHPISC